MNSKNDQKLSLLEKETCFLLLPEEDRDYIRKRSESGHFTFQNLKKIIEIAGDLRAWEEGSIATVGELEEAWTQIRDKEKSYENFHPNPIQSPTIEFSAIPANDKLLGPCPVSSNKTRCCNLMTLDVARNCGFACSYCSIQTFFHDNRILLAQDLDAQLSQLNLDPNKIYHIGTGQSSDSLLWGNRNGALDALLGFAKNNKNVILEFKTKSENIDYFKKLKEPPPPNIILTWTLNTQTIIKNEEHLTASLGDRLTAARAVADLGILVGFHLHPIIYYKGWKQDYAEVAQSLVQNFTPSEVALVSLGTVTLIKPVISKIRRHLLKTKILQMPLTATAGKFSYPYDRKLELFSHVYQAFRPWHDESFFYLCMEEPRLWQDVFGFEYSDNGAFEKAMISAYAKKVSSR